MYFWNGVLLEKVYKLKSTKSCQHPLLHPPIRIYKNKKKIEKAKKIKKAEKNQNIEKYEIDKNMMNKVGPK